MAVGSPREGHPDKLDNQGYLRTFSAATAYIVIGSAIGFGMRDLMHNPQSPKIDRKENEENKRHSPGIEAVSVQQALNVLETEIDHMEHLPKPLPLHVLERLSNDSTFIYFILGKLLERNEVDIPPSQLDNYLGQLLAENEKMQMEWERVRIMLAPLFQKQLSREELAKAQEFWKRAELLSRQSAELIKTHKMPAPVIAPLRDRPTKNLHYDR